MASFRNLSHSISSLLQNFRETFFVSVPEAVVIVQETGLRLAKKMNRLNKKKQEGGGG